MQHPLQRPLQRVNKACAETDHHLSQGTLNPKQVIRPKPQMFSVIKFSRNLEMVVLLHSCSSGPSGPTSCLSEHLGRPTPSSPAAFVGFGR